MAAIRKAKVVWQGDLVKGTGVLTADSSSAFRELGVTWASRTESPNGRTSPEELLASAHASCFSMALSAALAKAGTPPTRLEVTAAVTFDKQGEAWKVQSSALTVRGAVPNISPDAFKKAAQGAKDTCPISQALKGNVELSVDAQLA